MIPRRFQELAPGGQVSADGYNRETQAVEEASRVTGPGVAFGRFGLALRNEAEELDIRLICTPPDSMGRYSFEEVVKSYDPATGAQQWIKRDGGYEGNPSNFPAYEINDNPDVGEGTVTRAWRGLGDYLLFEFCCAGGSGSGCSGVAAYVDPFPIKPL